MTTAEREAVEAMAAFIDEAKKTARPSLETAEEVLETLAEMGWSPPRAAVGGEREAAIRQMLVEYPDGGGAKQIRDLLALLDAERAKVAELQKWVPVIRRPEPPEDAA
jgi:hypothetical protein